MQRTVAARRAATFKHTHISLYIVATCAFAVVSFDSAQVNPLCQSLAADAAQRCANVKMAWTNWPRASNAILA